MSCQCCDHFALRISRDGIPLDFGKGEGFKTLMSAVHVSYDIPQWMKAMMQVQKEADEFQKWARAMLQTALAVDVINNNDNTIHQAIIHAVTAHFIPDDWQPVSLLLELKGVYATGPCCLLTSAGIEMDESHTAGNHKKLIKKTFDKWHILNEVFTAATADNAANILWLCKDLKKESIVQKEIRCYCHTAQLAFKHGLHSKEIQPLLSTARDTVNHFTTTTIWLQSTLLTYRRKSWKHPLRSSSKSALLMIPNI